MGSVDWAQKRLLHARESVLMREGRRLNLIGVAAGSRSLAQMDYLGTHRINGPHLCSWYKLIMYDARANVIFTHLYSGLGKSNLLSQPLARKHVGVVRPLEFWIQTNNTCVMILCLRTLRRGMRGRIFMLARWYDLNTLPSEITKESTGIFLDGMW